MFNHSALLSGVDNPPIVGEGQPRVSQHSIENGCELLLGRRHLVVLDIGSLLQFRDEPFGVIHIEHTGRRGRRRRRKKEIDHRKWSSIFIIIRLTGCPH